MIATERAKAISSGRRLSPTKLFNKYRKSIAPEGGWTQEFFSGLAADALLTDISSVINVAKLNGVRSLVSELDSLVNQQFDDLIQQGHSNYSTITGTRNEDAPSSDRLLLLIWLLALRQISAKYTIQLTLTSTPIVQSVVDNVYRKIMDLLGVAPTKSQITVMVNRARNFAESLSQINNTTDERLTQTISGSNASTMAGIAALLLAKKPYIFTSRVGTIARTEIRKATDIAVISAYRDSKSVSHVSVVGCQAIEDNSPTYSGIPTCNIQNVPIQDVGKLKFHPNHTGIIVPSAFFLENGSAPKLTVSRGR